MTPNLRTRVQALAQQLLSDALHPSLADDRFLGSFSSDDSFRAALALSGDTAVGMLSGSINRGRLQFSGLVAPVAGPLAPTTTTAMSDLVSSGNLVESKKQNDPTTELLQDLFNAVEPGLADPAIEVVELWAHPETGWHRAFAESNGFETLRGLYQLRCQLPLAANADSASGGPSLATRSFDPNRDVDALVEINNRAFIDHPDQGAMTPQDLLRAMEQPWFSAEGLRVYDDPERATSLAGFCWTKIHSGQAGQPDLGEIYAIGIDPRHHGKGLGRPMTAAGLDWLTKQGLSTGMLYVEASNEPALRTYSKLGFTHHRTDRAWVRSHPTQTSPDASTGQ